MYPNSLTQVQPLMCLCRVLPNSLKGRGVCYHVYVIGAHKRTHVDRQNMPNHCTSIYHE